jgi:site-specific DNA recombinase
MPSHGPLASVFTFLDSWRAGRERRAILERTSRGRMRKIEMGKVFSRAAASYGYRFDRETSTLVIHEEEAKIVRLAAHMFLQERQSLVQLADRLNRLGVATPRNGKRWHSSALGKLLRNETYAGVLWQNRWRKVMKNGKPAYEERPRAEWIATQVPVIIPREIFDQVQSRLEENRRHAKRNARREYLLSGLLKHWCGGRMGGRFSRGNIFYQCYMSHHHKAPIDEEGNPEDRGCRMGNGHRFVEASRVVGEGGGTPGGA